MKSVIAIYLGHQVYKKSKTNMQLVPHLLQQQKQRDVVVKSGVKISHDAKGLRCVK